MLVQKVRPSIRLLCGGVGLVLLSMAVRTWNAGYGLADAAGWGVFAALFFVLAAAGMPGDDGEEPGSERFHELADPARTLSPEDLQRPGDRTAEAARPVPRPFRR